MRPRFIYGKVARLVARSRLGFPQPLNRFVELSHFDEVRADVVVWVAEGWVDSDRLLTLLDCLADATLKAVGPTAERVSLGGWVELERFCVELDCALKVTSEVVLLPLQPQPQCLVLENGIIHGSLRHPQKLVYRRICIWNSDTNLAEALASRRVILFAAFRTVRNMRLHFEAGTGDVSPKSRQVSCS